MSGLPAYARAGEAVATLFFLDRARALTERCDCLGSERVVDVNREILEMPDVARDQGQTVSHSHATARLSRLRSERYLGSGAGLQATDRQVCNSNLAL